MLGNFIGALSIAVSFGLAAMTAAWEGRHPKLALWLWGAAALFFVFGVCCLLWPLVRRTLPSLATPLKIIFDSDNPAQKFWRRTQAKDKDGRPVPVMIWEYRVGIYNNSIKTARNVRVSVETMGQLPVDPRDMGFLKDNKEQRDISPGHTELVPVWWVWPPQPGDAAGPTATAFHGPVRVVARADDIAPSEVLFDYAPGETPALVKLTPIRRC